MRRKRSWRYYCDFCKKSGGSASSLSVHERHCTMNPGRECRMCERPRRLRIRDVAEAIGAALRNSAGGLEELRSLAGDCPACMLSAIRLSGVQNDYWEGIMEGLDVPPCYLSSHFNFKEEKRRFYDGREHEN